MTWRAKEKKKILKAKNKRQPTKTKKEKHTGKKMVREKKRFGEQVLDGSHVTKRSLRRRN